MNNIAQARTFEILLVEDNPGDILLTRKALEEFHLGTQVAVARDGEEAISYLKQRESFTGARRPDIILLDLNLPRLDGREVLEEIKKDPELRQIPVVILTSSEAQTDIKQAYALSANSYVVKPMQGDAFLEAVRNINHYWLDTARLPAGQ